jgi:citrate lyase subunit beta/citryl-CoA lyase
MSDSRVRPRRSVLYVPASSPRALAKLPSLACDAVIVDLEDAVLPTDKAAARAAMSSAVAGRRAGGPEMAVRINGLSTPWGREDLAAACAARPDAILLPKVDGPRDVLDADGLLDEVDVDPRIALWVMVETPRAVLNLGAIAELGRDRAARLSAFVAGTNDLAEQTGVAATPDRRWLQPWLQQIVLAARAAGVAALDGVRNDFADLAPFEAECAQGAAMGFDGKTLIHPAQIEGANRAFSPSDAEIAHAVAVLEAFARPDNADRGVIAVDGRMVERLHLAAAKRILARAGVQP